MPTKSSRKAASKSAKSPAYNRRKTGRESPAKSEWNILYYFAGDGLLSATMISQLKDITSAGFQENTNVLVYFDPNCNGRNARIFNVNALLKSSPDSPASQIGDGEDFFVRDIAEDCHVPGLPQIPAAITLRYFLEYARTYYPAKNYLLFLMGHGVIVGNDTFLPDPDDNSAISLSDLGWILKRFANQVREDNDEFHLVGFHSCSMSSIELAYEIAGSARYMLGTQGAAFPGSWPYRQLLKRTFLAIDDKGRGNGNGHAVEKILDGLQDLSFYNAQDFWLAGFSADLSLCDLEPKKVDTLRAPIELLSDALLKGLEDDATKDSIQLAHLESQSYWGESYTDLFDFCGRLSQRCQDKTPVQSAIRNACEKVTVAINGLMPDESKPKSTAADGVVLRSDYYGPAYQYSNGLSIFFPWRRPTASAVEAYRGYKFTREHGSKSWWIFLNQYFRATQRPARRINKPRCGQPDVVRGAVWRTETNLLRTLSDERLLSLGPPPAGRNGAPHKGVAPQKPADLEKIGGDLEKVGGDLEKVGGDLEKVGGDLSKVGGDLAEKVGGDLEKVGGDLAEKVGGDLAKVEGDLTKLMGQLSKVGGDLSKVGGDLSFKVGGDLSKVGGDLEKVGGDLEKVGGDLEGKVGGDLSKVGGDLSKVGGDLSKVGGDLGGLYGHTIVKNFESPEDSFVSSREVISERALMKRRSHGSTNGHKRPTKHRR